MLLDFVVVLCGVFRIRDMLQPRRGWMVTTAVVVIVALFADCVVSGKLPKIPRGFSDRRECKKFSSGAEMKYFLSSKNAENRQKSPKCA